ncbi:hypothetical protein [Liquorilactobacillus capillatus]|uniref:Uncharacterized protein n=1 Tax=Liquorilactobacillus capillatus DSM 19910 TaxID=1423731 RepID=A0A0R1MBF2_9LACO|nr:hypothetical protein [Liquorilactobacillus capillatus]KRL03156.1 hypothetical protein FC81_GL000158 [Liquorilactobacillus capillatus DSM 19910]
MGNKFDILAEYQAAEAKVAELNDVCEKINHSSRGRHLLNAYDEKRRNLLAERDHLEIILEAMSAAED